ncbi:hypothetical protein B0H14DRAFT_3454270 [Mycena olivaceomarginata]|nr:hypothetical protein B0H14DRAFT_3454270 [Mycena olivaceomarginata]
MANVLFFLSLGSTSTRSAHRRRRHQYRPTASASPKTGPGPVDAVVLAGATADTPGRSPTHPDSIVPASSGTKPDPAILASSGAKPNPTAHAISSAKPNPAAPASSSTKPSPAAHAISSTKPNPAAPASPGNVGSSQGVEDPKAPVPTLDVPPEMLAVDLTFAPGDEPAWCKWQQQHFRLNIPAPQDKCGDCQIDEGFIEDDLEANLQRDKYTRLCNMVNGFIDKRTPSALDFQLCDACDRLLGIMADTPKMQLQLVSSHGTLAILEVLEGKCSQDQDPSYDGQEWMQLFSPGLMPFPNVLTSLDAFTAANLTACPAFFRCTPSSKSSSHAASVHSKTPPGLLLIYIATAPLWDAQPPRLTSVSSLCAHPPRASPSLNLHAQPPCLTSMHNLCAQPLCTSTAHIHRTHLLQASPLLNLLTQPLHPTSTHDLHARLPHTSITHIHHAHLLQASPSASSPNPCTRSLRTTSTHNLHT